MTCTNTPKAGIYQGKPCLRDAGHTGAHVYDQAKLEATLAAERDAQPFTADEAVAAFSEAEIAERAQAVDDAHGVWESARFKAMPKMPCPACAGNGYIMGGMSEVCDGCFGKRVVQDAGEDFVFTMPDFAALKAPLVAYGNALAWRQHGKPAALPPAESVPTMDAIDQVLQAGRAKHRELGAGRMPAGMLPAAPPPDKRGFQSDGGIESTATDAEIDEIEAEIVGGEGGEGG